MPLTSFNLLKLGVRNFPSGSGSIIDTIRNPDTGMIIPFAVVRFRNTATNEVTVLTADENGILTGGDLIPGIYDIEISSNGTSFFYKNVPIEAEANQSLILTNRRVFYIGSVQDVVRDLSTGSVIPSATATFTNTVSFEVYVMTSDSNGQIFGSLKIGTYNVSISSPGYQVSNYENIVVDRELQKLLPGSQQIFLKPLIVQNSGYLTGKVTDKDGNSIKGCSVEIFNESGVFVNKVSTDLFGNYYSGILPYGKYMIQFFETTKKKKVIRDFLVNSPESVLSATLFHIYSNELPYSINSMVFDGNSIVGIPGAVITLSRDGIIVSQTTSYSTSTNDYCYYDMVIPAGELIPGLYEFSASASGFETETRTFDWRSERTSVFFYIPDPLFRLRKILVPHSISGYVTCECAGAVEGVHVYVTDLNNILVKQTMTSATGYYNIDDIILSSVNMIFSIESVAGGIQYGAAKLINVPLNSDRTQSVELTCDGRLVTTSLSSAAPIISGDFTSWTNVSNVGETNCSPVTPFNASNRWKRNYILQESVTQSIFGNKTSEITARMTVKFNKNMFIKIEYPTLTNDTKSLVVYGESGETYTYVLENIRRLGFYIEIRDNGAIQYYDILACQDIEILKVEVSKESVTWNDVTDISHPMCRRGFFELTGTFGSSFKTDLWIREEDLSCILGPSGQTIDIRITIKFNATLSIKISWFRLDDTQDSIGHHGEAGETYTFVIKNVRRSGFYIKIQDQNYPNSDCQSIEVLKLEVCKDSGEASPYPSGYPKPYSPVVYPSSGYPSSGYPSSGYPSSGSSGYVDTGDYRYWRNIAGWDVSNEEFYTRTTMASYCQTPTYDLRFTFMLPIPGEYKCSFYVFAGMSRSNIIMTREMNYTATTNNFETELVTINDIPSETAFFWEIRDIDDNILSRAAGFDINRLELGVD